MSTSPEEGREAGFFTAIRSWGLVRSEHRVFGGVLAGIGARIGLAPVPARLLFVVLCVLTGGISVLAYAAAWALLPDHEGHIVIQDFGRGVPKVGQLIAIVVLGLIGFFTLGEIGPGRIFRPVVPWGMHNDLAYNVLGGAGFMNAVFTLLAVLIPLAFVGAVVAVIVWAVRGSRKPSATSVAGYGAVVPDAGAAAAASSGSEGAGVADDSPGEAVPAAAGASTGGVAVAAPVYAAAPPVYAAPRPPKPPRVPGAGPVAWLLALALVPLSLAVAYWLDYRGELAIYPWLAAWLIWVAGLGLIIAGAALSGRRVGGLGTLAALALVPTIALAVDADGVRASWQPGPWEEPVVVAESEWPEEPPIPEMDPAVVFADYDFVQINGNCWANSEVYPSGAIVSLGAVTQNVTVDLTAPETRVIVPRGTSLVIEAAENWESYSTLAWVDRDIACEAAPRPGTWARLTNVDTPVVTLRIPADASVGSIYIEEN